MQTNAIMKMNLQYSIFLVLYGTFVTCQTKTTTEKEVHSENNYTTTNEGNYLEKENANDFRKKESTPPTPFSVAIIHSENRAYSSKGENIFPIHSKTNHDDSVEDDKSEMHKRQSETQSDEISSTQHLYDTREDMYKPAIPQNHDYTSYFPKYGNVYDYKRNSKREKEYNGERFDDLNEDHFWNSWKSAHNTPYFATSDESRPIHEPNLARKLAGKFAMNTFRYINSKITFLVMII